MIVRAEINEETLQTDAGRPIDGITAHCTRCHWETESFGTSIASVKRCLVLLREGCPRGESNWYEGDQDDYD